MTDEQRMKDSARSYANTYLRRGKIERKGCRVCGEPAEMHHPDYARPLEVVWLCRRHHLDLHSVSIEAEELAEPPAGPGVRAQIVGVTVEPPILVDDASSPCSHPRSRLTLLNGGLAKCGLCEMVRNMAGEWR